MRNARFGRKIVGRNLDKLDSSNVAKSPKALLRHSSNSQNIDPISTDDSLSSASIPSCPSPKGSTTSSTFSRLSTFPSSNLSLGLNEPVLLLEGDQYRISEDGMAHSLYHLMCQSPNIHDENLKPSSVAIEEIYDLDKAQKIFVIRADVNGRLVETLKRNKTDQGWIVHLGDPNKHLSVTIQEIAEVVADPRGVVSNAWTDSGPGTGSRTWDSSLAMSMYFALHPESMAGDVIELGSGVGLGGILSFLFRSLCPSSVPFQSLTLTDYKNQVLECCTENVNRFLKSRAFSSSIEVTKLDWYDFLDKKKYEGRKEFDTIIACDCAYLYPDIVALVKTMKGLLKRQRSSKVHIFGPSNRGGLHQLISDLRKDESFDVEEEYIDMVRYRLDVQAKGKQSEYFDSVHGMEFLSECSNEFDSKFLHVTCSIHFDSGKTSNGSENSPWDID